jgi:adenylosuccinate lyase
MACVKRGGDRQEIHEVIRKHSQAATAQVKQEGKENDLLERLASDPAIAMTRDEIDALLDLRAFVGRAPQQVTEFIENEVQPVLHRHEKRLGAASHVHV